MGWIVSTLTYAGLALALAGAVLLAYPLLIVGVVLALTGAWWPWPVAHHAGSSRLDAVLPDHQFREFHETRVRAAPEAIDRALRAVTAGEIRFFRLLTSMRAPRFPGQARPESILQPDWKASILDVATRSGFVWLADEPQREVVVGTILAGGAARAASAEAFHALTRPSGVKAAMNFRIEAGDDGYARLTTETRVFALGTGARRRFGLYWAAIYPGSSLIRYGWLEAIRRRAEAATR